MTKVLLFSMLLIFGLACSQLVGFVDPSIRPTLEFVIKNLTLVFLSFIMIHVGLEFTIDHSKLKSYAWDYFVAFTAASFPWIFCALYFFYFAQHDPNFSKWNIFIDCLLLARFASPTSAGVLFTMLSAAGLEPTWVFKKARVLAIFDDLDTIILLLPIKMMIIGFKWELILLLVVIVGLIYLAWKKMRTLSWPLTWPWVLLYAILITALCEIVYTVTYYLEDVLPLHIEVLLPAFVLGCILAFPKGETIHELLDRPSEKTVQTLVSAAFMFIVGASMPLLSKDVLSAQNLPGILFDVLALTVLSNLGKMFPLFCYQKEATIRERLALAIAMCPRGEVGAGIIVISLSLILHLDYKLIVAAMLSLGLNLLLTGGFIVAIKKLLSDDERLKQTSESS
ncbi:MAG: sodium:proton antiporter [Parachlamydia sp.]|nr:MAG: sodium:proton antiporter [Parachlamydia sp.]